MRVSRMKRFKNLSHEEPIRHEPGETKIPKWVKRPKWDMSKEGRAEWDQLAPILWENGRLDRLCAPMLAIYCDALATQRYYEEKYGNNPAIMKQLKDGMEDFEKIVTDLGLEFLIWPIKEVVNEHTGDASS
jgi:phage terminase small subunit